MNKSPLAGTGNLSVSIVAGPSAGALLQQIGEAKEKRRLVLPAGSLAPDEHQALEQISAIAEQREVENLIIECDSQTPAMAYASLFLSPPLTETARLTKTLFVIQPSDLLDSLTRRAGDAKRTSPGFLAEQLEFVNHIVLDGGIGDSEFKLARDIALTLNPRAQVSDLSPESVEKLLGGAELPPFDFSEAFDGAGWRQLIDAEKLPRGESDIASFAYRARRPFHPERFLALLEGGLAAVFRAKGFFWLATRMDLVGGLNLAGSELHCAGAGQWWAARDAHTREDEMPERTQKEWQEPFGDRRQAIAFMGLDFHPDACRAQLNACLLTDSEMSAGPESWGTLPDPFPSWTVHSHTHACEHDHESGDHDCCHH
ncbi:MAG TPA: GTP-binding protein [Chthoniobacterales bacterium]|nr:GTP-binding protein [Chthoniobacterales bacterium]